MSSVAVWSSGAGAQIVCFKPGLALTVCDFAKISHTLSSSVSLLV